MTADELQELETKVRRARFTMSQKASVLHDLIEDRLPTDFMEIPTVAQATFEACNAWKELNNQLVRAKEQQCQTQ